MEDHDHDRNFKNVVLTILKTMKFTWPIFSVLYKFKINIPKYEHVLKLSLYNTDTASRLVHI